FPDLEPVLHMLNTHRRWLARSSPLAILGIALAVTWWAAAWVPAQPPSSGYEPRIDAASGEAELALQRMQLAPGLKVSLWAAEPMLANPVCLAIDHRGRIFVAETFRLNDGVSDIRGLMAWLDDDLACRTVDDRDRMMRKWMRQHYSRNTVHHDRIRHLEDTTGDGRADRSTVFADGFNEAVDGIGAGLLVRGQQVWFACIPHLWLLEEDAKTRQAQSRRSLHSGYGVHIGFIGHDLHGLIRGPDGRLYFSIGDRGLHVERPEGAVVNADSGAVLRCWPDGSDLEIVHVGLRNPQELAFDDWGNLFTLDNNSDAGDQARIVHVVDGGDSGWRLGYQFIEAPRPRGAWHGERMWHPERARERAAFMVPPIANFTDGPSGLAFDPGTGLPERYRGRFLICDFRGGPAGSGIWSFGLEAQGAGFRLESKEKFVWNVLATDVDFGPDGAVYFTDWVTGWGKPHRGRIYRIADAEASQRAIVAETQKLLASDWSQVSFERLLELLDHANRRVRLEAQWTLADRATVGPEAERRQPAIIDELLNIIRKSPSLPARVHAVWALGQIGPHNVLAAAGLLLALDADEAELRAQACKCFPEVDYPEIAPRLIRLLKDESPRVRFHAAQALGRMKVAEAVRPLLDLLHENDDQDGHLRAAVAIALARIGKVDPLVNAAGALSVPVRRGAVVALRRLQHPDIAQFLRDSDPAVLYEAARAITEAPIPQAFPQLALLAQRRELPEPVWQHVLFANFAVGGPLEAEVGAGVAARTDLPKAVRAEAIRMLRHWAKPSGRDWITGLWRPLGERPADGVIAAATLRLPFWLTGPMELAEEAAQLAGTYRIEAARPLLIQLLTEPDRPAKSRVLLVQALAALPGAETTASLTRLLADRQAEVRAAARTALARLDAAAVLPVLQETLERGELVEQQAAAALLGELPNAADLLAEWLMRLEAGRVPVGLRLDLLEAARRRKEPAIQKLVETVGAVRDSKDELAPYRDCLTGGDAERGRKLFLKTELSCVRCHKLAGEGGEVGPDLTQIGKQHPREYLLEALVLPNAKIATGFETVVILLTNGKVVTGVLKQETETELKLLTAEAEPVTVKKADIEERKSGASTMPADLMQHISLLELRDLVEYLSSLK
ncbi:MAG TPA: HEAT repeat domain-containing protein, partial [Gemmatales bacterium]|nr:HEAT repeat domain-containing protein [Gemmatales bacterium]